MGDNTTSTEDMIEDIAEAPGGEQGASEDACSDQKKVESSEGSAGSEDELSVLQAEMEGLNQQLSDAKDQALRAVAESQNQRRRAERDIESAHKFGQEKLISALLPVLDNLDRAIESVNQDDSAEHPESVKQLIEGVELTRKSALDALQKFSVEVLEPYGEPFDPQKHEAMTMVPSDTAEPNSVIDVLQKGYSLHGRLLRAAMVVVAK